VTAFICVAVLCVLSVRQGEASQLQAGSDSLLHDALGKIELLRARVDRGSTPRLGAKAQEIVTATMERAGPDASKVERALDAVLYDLFLRQLFHLEQKVIRSFCDSGDAVKTSLQLFEKEALALVKPRSGWSYERQLAALRGLLTEIHQRDRELARERRTSSQTMRATSDIMNHLRTEMHKMQEQIQGNRAGDPWALSTFFMIPNTPLQVRARYNQGCTHMELHLFPDSDPAQSEAGFVEGWGPGNLDLSLNIDV